jgi:hypothetical protein
MFGIVSRYNGGVQRVAGGTKARTLLVIALLCLPISASKACEISLVCPHHGFEVANKFTVAIRHAGRPLKSALVEVILDEGGNISKTTEATGVVLFENLPPGNYHISVSFLGIDAVYECFHVAKWKTARTAKRRLTYSWGDDAPKTRKIAGKLTSRYYIDEPREQHPNTSVTGIHLTLIDPIMGTRYEATSDPDGFFFPSDIAEGVYVLHSEGDKSRRYYPADILIRLSRTAARKKLVLELGGGGGDCRSALELVN